MELKGLLILRLQNVAGLFIALTGLDEQLLVSFTPIKVVRIEHFVINSLALVNRVYVARRNIIDADVGISTQFERIVTEIRVVIEPSHIEVAKDSVNLSSVVAI